MDDEEDEDTFVTIGTPLEPYEEDEVVKKPTRVQDQTAHDSKGRRRFHGAFTGGFSAGYFNTVGSEQGWTPSTFVSSRNKKCDTPASRKPENFMDDEDLGEHGIAPRNVAPTDDFASALKKRTIGAVCGDGVIPGASPLEDIIVPAKCPIGVRLLKKLGWKEGQGVGPRVKRKARRRRKQPTAESEQKVYGCSLPPGNNEEGESDEDEYAEGITFAPKDVNPICFTPKDNLHGIGYHGIDPKTALFGSSGHVSLFEPAAVSSGRKKGVTGQAFGIGAFEEEDDDIYTVDHLSNYDRELGGPEKDRLHGWTAPKHRAGDSVQLAIGNVAAVLENFKLSSNKCRPKKVYPPPQLPRDFRPYHTPSTTPGVIMAVPPPGRQSLDANVRGLMLGEMPRRSSTGSVFDVLATQKVEPPKLPQAKISFTVGSASPQVKNESPDVSAQSPVPRIHQPLDTPPLATTPVSSAPAGFQPFARTPEKQARYEKFLEFRKQGKADTYEEYARQSLTEWESRQEAAEFARAAQLYRPLSGSMAMRFTKAHFDDTVSSAELPHPEQGVVSAQQKAAEMKLFGKLTRETTKWRPDKLLCKRFNVPNPYPDESGEVRKVKREKFSIFNFLSAPREPESMSSDQKQETLALAAIEPPNTAEATQATSVKTEAVKADPAFGVVESNTQPTDGTRPPMDLFKAIFGDSSNSDSSDSEMDQDVALPTPTDAVVPPLPDTVGVTEPPPHTAAAIMETSNGTIRIEAVAQRLDPSVDSTSVATPDDDEKASLQYGPALPPPPTTQGPAQSSMNTPRKHTHKDKKHKHKSHKKKKSRHKKHKKQQKRHKTKTDTDSDTEDSDDSVPTDTQLLNKLQSLLPGQRKSI